MQYSKEHQILSHSLVFVWLATALVSVWELHGQSLQLLTSAGLPDGAMVRLLILSGAGVDAVLGFWMLLKPSRIAYLAALLTMLIMTMVATILAPSLWLHPLGPLTKNMPIAAVLWLLARGRI